MSTNYTEFTNEELVLLIREGNEKERELAMEAIIEKNDNLILFLINKHFPSYKANYLDDMRQEGRRAIFEHAAQLDPTKGRFSTYLTPYIVEACKNFICETHSITTHYAGQIKKMNKAIDLLRNRGIENPTFGEIAEEMGVGIDAVQRVFEVNCRLNPVSIEGDSKDRELCNAYNSSPEALFEQQEDKETLYNALGQLSQQQQDVIYQTFFADPKREKSMKEVAKILKTDVATVRRAKNLAFMRLQNILGKAHFSQSPKRNVLEEFSKGLTVTFMVPDENIEEDLDLALGLS